MLKYVSKEFLIIYKYENILRRKQYQMRIIKFFFSFITFKKKKKKLLLYF